MVNLSSYKQLFTSLTLYVYIYRLFSDLKYYSIHICDRTNVISALSRSLDRVEILISCSVHKCECQCGTPMLTSYSIESTSIRFQLLRGEVFKLCRISTKITATHNILPIFVIRELNFSIIVRCKTMQPPSPLFF